MHSKNTSYRPDIDGLRAVAVLLVLLFHFDLGVSGGFIGVDVFFVISGFLITEVIRNSINAKRFSFSDFYARRLLRLHPALIVTVGLSLAAGFLLMDPASFKGLAEAAKYSIFSASNFYFWQNQGYFDASAQTNPLLHTWSLAAEWQFYVVWPFIIWAALKLSDKFLIGLLIAMTVTSLIASQLMLSVDSAAAYFMMPFRVFELSMGGLLVFIHSKRINPNIEAGILIAGLAMILGSAFALSSNSPFPGIRALFPCLGAAACIYAGQSQKFGLLLRMRPVVYIGLISYSVYLVHWPIVVFYKYYIFRDLGITEKISLLLVSLIAGTLLYYTVERIFMGKKSHIKPMGLSAIAVSIALLTATSIYVIDDQGIKSRIPEKYLAFASDPASFHTKNYGGSGYPLETLLGDKDGKLAAVIGGDSIALQYASGFDKALGGKQISISGVFMHGCVLSPEYTRMENNSPRQDCRDKYKKIKSELEDNNLPLILAQHWIGYKGQIADSDGNLVPLPNPYAYTNLILKSLEGIREDIGSRELIIIGSLPSKGNLESPISCLLRPTYIEQQCESMLGFAIDDAATKWMNLSLAGFAEKHENTKFVDVANSLCLNGYCSPFRDGKVLYSNASHLSIEGSIIAGKQILQDTQLIPETK